MRIQIGIIGYGTVGQAYHNFFKDKCDIAINDPKYEKSVSIQKLKEVSSLILICVPANTKNNGEIDTSILYKILANLNNQEKSLQNNPLVCIKTTILPDIANDIINRYKYLKICYTPEYIRDDFAFDDVHKFESLVIGGELIYSQQIETIFKKYGTHYKTFKTSFVDIETAAFLKYMENSFLGLKVSFMNEMFDVFNALETNIPWVSAMDAFHNDSRMGNSHYFVPGPDGKRGWGGKCLPKDIAAFIKYIKNNNFHPRLLESVAKINKDHRF